jgi:hypothetical protein
MEAGVRRSEHCVRLLGSVILGAALLWFGSSPLQARAEDATTRGALAATLEATTTMPEPIPVVSPGFDPGATEKLGVRYLHFLGGVANHGVYLGASPDAPDRSASYVLYWSTDPDNPNHVTLTYDAAAGTLTSSVSVQGRGDVLTSYPAAGALPAQDPLNCVHIQVVRRQPGTEVALRNVTIEGIGIGDFVGDGWKDWNVTGLDLSAGFVITGDIYLTGPQPQREMNKVQINVGHTAPSAVQRADFNGDHIVDIADVGLIGLHWGEQGAAGWIPEDINGDGIVDIGDVAALGLLWLETW